MRDRPLLRIRKRLLRCAIIHCVVDVGVSAPALSATTTTTSTRHFQFSLHRHKCEEWKGGSPKNTGYRDDIESHTRRVVEFIYTHFNTN